ncbi:MFS transporter [Taibaiella soli]|uniref:MFS transporter n=1 Tax=Taibaiella soli TaxID=1649169 RepID=A0A2W2AGK1_9BACT|nr:MFS transporter [Taibaiella soli]PZF72652.1 MFS transporter [Taibaiella soli]
MSNLTVDITKDKPDIRITTERATRQSARFKKIKFCIFLSGLSVFAQLYLFQPLLPTVAQHFGTSVGNSSLLVSSATIGMALGLFFFGLKADSFSRKKQMSFALIASAILTIISFQIQSLSLLITLGLMKGFVLAGVSSVALAYLTEEVEFSVIGLAISMYLNGNTIGGMSGRILAIIFAGAFGWRNAVLLIGIESLFLGLLFWKFFPESQLFQPQSIPVRFKLKQMKGFISNSLMLPLFIIGGLMVGTFVSVYNYLTFRLEAKPFSLNHYWIAFIFLMYAFGVVGAIIARKLSEHYKLRQVLRGFLLLFLLGVGLMIFDNLALTITGLGLLTTAFFAAHTMASRMVAIYAVEGKSAATSLYWLFYYTGSGIVGSSSGYLLHATNWSVYTISLMALIAVACLLTISKEQKL